MSRTTIAERARSFCERYGLALPILEAPMAGVCPPERSAAVVRAGGMGGVGVLMMNGDVIRDWVRAFRSLHDGPLQMNLWIPDAPAARDAGAERRVSHFLEQWGPPVSASAGDTPLNDFDVQCDAMIEARPTAISSIMGLYEPRFVARMRAAGIAWYATATTVAEARAAAAAGADAIVVQGMEAGGHRGSFEPGDAEGSLVGLFALLPRVVDVVDVPVIAAGGIGDGRTVAAALMLGASAVEIGTALLRAEETGLPSSWHRALDGLEPEDTTLTRIFSGRAGRSIATDFVRAAASSEAPAPAPYPVQRGLSAAMRADAVKRDDINGMQAWSGQGAALARREPAGDIVRRVWSEARSLLPDQLTN